MIDPSRMIPLVACLCLSMTLTVTAAGDYLPPPEAKGGWRSLVSANAAPTPLEKEAVRKQAGLDWDRLLEAWRYATNFGGPHSMLVIRHGWIAGEWHNFAQPRGIASCTKSITGLAMARLLDLSDSGALKKRISLDDYAYLYLPASWAQSEPARREIRIRHLLTMTSGLTPYDGPYRDDYETKVFGQSVEAPPGAVWAYNSAPVDLLSCIIENLTDRKLGDFFNDEIGVPIGTARVRFPEFSSHSGGSGGPGGGAQFTARDLARVGYLLLRSGAWEDNGLVRRVLTADRVAQFTQWAPMLEGTKWRQPNFAFEPNANAYYGCLFWNNRTQQGLGTKAPRDAFYMSGWGKQVCAVIPSLDLVVVRLGGNRVLNDHPEFYPEFFSRVLAAVVSSQATSASGPLRVHPANPRYFTDGTTNADGSLKAIYLGGHQIFIDLQDNSFNKEWTKDMSQPENPATKARLLDWDRYLQFVEKLEFNYIRNWIIWSTGSGTAAPPRRIISHRPFARTGAGTANDGKPKFDLRRFDESFFQRLHDRARALQERGVYLSVMLFELYGFLDGEPENGQRLWEGNLFNSANNINGLDADRNQNRLGEEFFSLENPEVVKIQKAYLEKMVDALNDLDNILWEICNEPPSASIEWQYEMLRHLKAYEARKSKQHPILLSPGGWTPGSWSLTPEVKYIQSAADCIATANGWIDRDNPKAYQINKPVFMDLDHVAPGNSDPALVWKGFTRGYHFCLYDHPFEQPQNESTAWQVVRANVSHTRLLANRVRDMARMRPRENLSSTGFCLANEGQDYIIYAPRQEAVRVQGLLADRKYRCEWFNTARGSIQETAQVASDAPALSLQPPCPAAVLFMTLDADGAAAPTELPPLRLGPKPADAAVERRPRPQPTAPDGAKEIPFDETAPEPALTEPEKQRGYLLFHRPIMESVYPNTRPLPHERLEALVAFAAPGEFEPVTFALYPVRPLQNLKVRVSPLTSPSGEIPASRIDVRLATYWNVGYPAYTTLGTYRRVPELLERVTVHTSPAGECQRYWLTVHVPDDAKPGLYRGAVAIWDDGFGQAVEIPLALCVLGLRLKKDPRKHFSVYFYARNRVLYKGRDDAFIRQAADKDYQAMVNYGLDMLPTLYLICEDGKRIALAEAGELERMLAAGLKGPAPVTADNAIARIYHDTTPGGKRENHWRVNPMPPPAFYDRVTELFRAFEAERRDKGWPEFICCPIDEVDASCKEFGAKVYAAVKAAGLRTYATKDPIGADAADYAPHLDIWCSQPYSVPYDRIVSQDRHEYWCYPNHNACEIKDRRTMCKGGRMTYGFGFWRSGYTTLIPWHWSWPSDPDPFDYLRGRYSGCGQRVDDDGDVIPAVYWSCFREGYDDARYIYTLQQAIVQREGSKNPACLAAVSEGRRLLQETWDAINVQPKYLADGMWPSEEFNAVRWCLAAQTVRLLEFPATGKEIAPSVLITTSTRPRRAAQTLSPYETAARTGSLETIDLGGSFNGWKSGTAEGKTEVAEAARRAGKIGLRWTVEIDHKNDGGEGGNYPVGWPRIGRDFKPGELDMSRHDTLEFWIRIDSNRDDAADDHTPVGLVITSHNKKTALYETTADLGGEQRVWVPLRFPVKQMMSAAEAGASPWKSVSRVQLYVSEHDYAHGTRLVFDVGEVSLLRLTTPMIAGLDAPRHVLLPCRTLAFAFDVIGIGAVAKGRHTVAATIEGAGGAARADARQDLAAPHWMAMTLPTIKPGDYTLRLTIRDAEGKKCSESAQPVMAHAGPLY